MTSKTEVVIETFKAALHSTNAANKNRSCRIYRKLADSVSDASCMVRQKPIRNITATTYPSISAAGRYTGRWWTRPELQLLVLVLLTMMLMTTVAMMLQMLFLSQTVDQNATHVANRQRYWTDVDFAPTYNSQLGNTPTSGLSKMSCRPTRADSQAPTFLALIRLKWCDFGDY